jgi:hypothetical protein
MDVLIYFRLWLLTNSEVITYVSETDRQIQDGGGAERLGIIHLYPLFSELSGTLQQNHQTALNNPVTAGKEKAESYRANRFSAFTAFIRNALYDTNPEITAAAEKIMDIINSIGNFSKLRLSQETTEINSLSARLEPLMDQVTLIGANVRLQELYDANREFERLQNEWYKAGGKKTASTNTNLIRQQLSPLYKSMIYRINSLIEINGIEQYKSFVDAHNTMIESYKNMLAQRKGRQKNK